MSSSFWETNLENVIEYPGKQDFLQFGGIGLLGNLLANFGRRRHALRCFEAGQEFFEVKSKANC